MCLIGNGHCYFSSKSFLNLGSTSTKFLTKWFLIKKLVLLEFMKYKMYMHRNLQIYLFIKYFQLRI